MKQRARRRDVEALVAGRTVCSDFLATVERQPDDVALRWEESDGPAGMTWGTYADLVARVAAGLRSLGVGRGDRVGLYLRSRWEFHVVDMATLFLGATPLSVYNSSAPAQLQYFFGHAKVKVVVADDGAFARRVGEIADDLPHLRHVVVASPGDTTEDGAAALADLLAHDPIDLRTASADVDPELLATVIYTSGTTGDPKGVMLTHANVVTGVEMYSLVLDISLRGLRQLSYLPMAHVAERLATHYFPIVHGSVTTICPDLTQLPRLMAAVRPEWWFCAPRLWEKLHAGVRALVAADGEEAAFQEAVDVGWQVFQLRNEGRSVPPPLAERCERARSERIRPVLAKLGLDAVKIAITGSAPMPRDVHEFWLSCGLPLSDVYGQSETSGFISWDPDHIVPGTSGRPFPGVELRLADDGEILVRGPNVFAGYLDDPIGTAQALSEDGWLSTGDVGTVDPQGNLRVVDRKKELLVPASGHNVSPVHIEAALKESPLIGQACAVGDGRPHVTALVVLDPETTAVWAHACGLDGDVHVLAGAPEVREVIQAHVDDINSRFARPEQIKAFTVLGEEWLPDSDLLTPTAKLKRRGVMARYRNEIDAMYAPAELGS